ncbi:hypothetical protein E5F05_15390 [Deinococcus metallilatus]|uniref:Glycolipid-binding domain-containing protein n=1 Tax=Deinococcus metallilatus TaxID=1211322 RepID=A0AAJ5F2H2_9DEIO|nr:putative glycolipid-binding domain-containing protein [Deinococcus metallilatus]MBB5296706.1 hypothetical protein [Deinococcus metallilatus]QBY09214.1 hypothetical protein E5F05_15390 [Deinococcus metallilatus]RXJ09732.1 hypothetical protein ERJ73_14220 [Deinococcus metallilatus]TLK24198.1 hypothetical protein FCS05_15180 [Deinococcus metallilatus]GMA13737.1 hypothetical protein GCM10025871_00680 [Deinococcus metallilatus]
MNAAWRGLNPGEPSLEHLRLTPWTAVEGTVVGLREGQPYTLHYWLDLTEDGHPFRLRCDLGNRPSLDLTRSRAGEWTDAEGRLLPGLSGCTDVDLRATPFTNTLPIRRLGLPVGEAGEVRAVWVNVPTLETRVARQRYTRTGDLTYRYENLESGYVNEITVDGEGLVTLYPGAFGRLV